MVVIGLVGLKQSGKSTVARRLVEEHSFSRGRFAAALKDMLGVLLRYRGASDALVERMIEGDLKEIPSPLLNGTTPRHAMQTLGTEWGRDCIHNDLWVDTEVASVGRSLTKRVLFEDVRFENEVRAIRSLGGVIWQVQRPGQVANDRHASEQLRVSPDQTVSNDGSIGDLHAIVDRLVGLHAPARRAA